MRPLPRAEALAADEMWLSSSTKEVLAITMIDGKPFAGGKPGPVFRRVAGGVRGAQAAGTGAQGLIQSCCFVVLRTAGSVGTVTTVMALWVPAGIAAVDRLS